MTASGATAEPSTTGNEKMPQPTRRTPLRTCVACRTSGGKRGLLRVVRLPDGSGAEWDPTGKKSGRGAYVCANAACVVAAVKQKKLERALKTPISDRIVESLHAAVAHMNDSA